MQVAGNIIFIVGFMGIIILVLVIILIVLLIKLLRKKVVEHNEKVDGEQKTESAENNCDFDYAEVTENEEDSVSDELQVQKTLGVIIKTYRLENNMTQEYVAEKLNISRQAVSKWESGLSQPSTTNLMGLAKLFNVSVEDILKQIK